MLGEELRAAGKKADLTARLAIVASEDSDGDGVANEVELLLGHQPGDAADHPTRTELEQGAPKFAEFKQFLASYRWKPFESVDRTAVPTVKNQKLVTHFHNVRLLKLSLHLMPTRLR